MSTRVQSDAALTTALGWMLLVVVGNILYAALLIPETPLGSIGRTLVDRMHMSWGLVALILVLIRFWLLWRDPMPATDTASGILRDASIALYAAVLLLCLVGPVRGWAEGYKVPFFNLGALPNVVPAIYEVRVVAGYLHSALSFFVTGLIPVALILAVALGLRTGQPFYRLFPR
jgi:cytochrome b561